MTRRVRAAQRGTWFPLLLLGALTLGGILVNRFTFHVETLPCPATDPEAGLNCTGETQGSPYYWDLGLALAYVATAFFYIRRSRDRGVGTPVQPYILTGITLLGLVTATTFWATRHGLPQPGDPVDFWGWHLGPNSEAPPFIGMLVGNVTAVGLPLLVLSWVERSGALLLLALAYLALILVPFLTHFQLVQFIPVTSPWSAAPHLGLQAVLLLLGALGFGLAERSRRRDAS
ncbi:hypothetical protein [Streptomyces sp. TLI_146]|uniref:hypothetical protein n=1 Tax=Streptomyces sp. TLI_146 TaxID=1938858 RepID=UPI000C6FE0C4|nr:hypothetical protein [Streptomyces sp. TLI_146]PKV83004.1 hypothetical protein BX283_0492 [Streptomyces sp. TLI_146]